MMDAMRELGERLSSALITNWTGNRMKARHKRRTRRATISQSEQETLSRISAQLDRLQAPVSPDILGGINDKLSD
jgi:hypothetical protein